LYNNPKLQNKKSPAKMTGLEKSTIHMDDRGTFLVRNVLQTSNSGL